MKKFLTLLAALIVTGSMMVVHATDYYYRGNQNGWGATLMTTSTDGYYAYISALSYSDNGNKNNEFKIALSADGWDYNYSIASPGFNGTNITNMNSNSNSWGNGDGNNAIYHTTAYYVLVYFPNTDINTSSNPKMCASTTLPDDGVSTPEPTPTPRSFDGSTPLYFNAGAISWWTNANAIQKATFTKADNSTVVVTGTVESGQIYAFTPSAGSYVSVKFSRHDPSTESQWNATGAISLEGTESNDYITSFTENSSTVSWDVYSYVAPTYTVAGSATAFGTSWNKDDTNNDMTLVGELYTLEKENVTLSEAVELKVYQNHTWTGWPSSNYVLSISETAIYTVTVTFNESTKEVNASAVKTGEAGPVSATYTVAGDEVAFGTNWDPTNTDNDMSIVGELYTWSKENVTLYDDVELKVCKDHAWDNSWPTGSSNYVLSISEAAIYSITVTFNADTKEVSASATKTADLTPEASFTFTGGTTIYVDFSAMTEGAKGVNYPNVGGKWLDYDGEGAGNIKTVTFSADVTRTTNDVFIKTEKAGWAELKFIVPGDGQNCAVVAADGASYTWGTHAVPVVAVEAKGEWDGWTDALAFVPDGSGLTATATKHFDAGNYDFKLIVDGNWLSNANAFHRFWTSASGITSDNDENMQLQADADGDYILTWTFATNALSITFPETPKTGTNEVKFFPPRTEEHPWSSVYVYAWRRTAGEDVRLTDEWPGDLATKDGEWYKATIAKGACAIFHDNAGMQSFDIMNVQKDVCYISNEIVEGDPIKAKFYESCTVDYYLTGDAGIMGSENAWKADVAERKLDGSNQITRSLSAGIYEFKITNGSWAWSLGGKEHLNSACSNVAVTSGSGNVKFKIESAQSVTISYDPATQKICLNAETVLPFEDVRAGLTPDNYYTICNSREMKQIRGASLWSFASKDASFAYLVREDAPFAAGKPFIVWAESDKIEAILDGSTEDAGLNGALHGTFSLMEQGALDAAATNAGHDLYLVIGNALHRATGNDLDGITPLTGNSLPAYRAYVVVDEIPNTGAPAGLPKHRVRAMPMQTNVATGIDALNASEKPVKMMIDGQLFILRGEKLYDATGRLVK